MRYFSIIIPLYNREKFIARAINSCLKQDFDDFDIIIVDDGSTDNSVEVVRKFTDPRIKLICHRTNQERFKARNTGADAASGKWLVFLDSDDELLSNALSIMHNRTKDLEYNIAGARFMCQLDIGILSPNPPLKIEVWDYEKYICDREAHYGQLSESLLIRRKHSFETVRLHEEDKYYTGEFYYHLNFTKEFEVKTFPDVVRLYHQDAGNNTWKPNIKLMLLAAPSYQKRINILLHEHGDSLLQWAPKVYNQILLGRVTQTFYMGQRRKGVQYAMCCLRRNPFSVKTFAIIIFGLLGPRPLSWLKTVRQWIHYRSGTFST